MQFITSGNRIAVENFTLGDLYTITFTNGNYINSACIGIGENFVSFQRNEPELLFTLNMETAELVSSIDLYAGGTGTNNYNELTNKPQIGGVELVGNKSLSDLGIQSEITAESPLSSAFVSGLGSAATAESTDFATAAQGALADTAVQPAALNDYQTLIDNDNKLSADLVDDTSTTNKFATSAQLDQIETNKNNILSSLTLVAHTSANGNTSLTYDTNTNDFNIGGANSDKSSGSYLVICTNWSTTPAPYIGLLTFSGATSNSFVKTDVVTGFIPTITITQNVANATIDISGAAKISIYATK